jgi:hypothetical protein
MRLRGFLLRRTAEILFGLLLSQLLACGSFRVAGAIQQSNATVTTGTVSVVRLTVISNSNGTFVNVTAVTLLVPMGSSSLMLCGDQRSNFVMNSNVQVSFTAGANCSNLVRVAEM